MKKKGDAWGDLEGRICPIFRFSSMNSLHVCTSWGFNRYIFATFSMKDSFNSMAWSNSHWRGRVLNICSEKMLTKSAYWGGRVTSFFWVAIASLVDRVVFRMCLSLNEIVFFIQSIWGLFLVNQGIPKTTWACPRPTIMRERSSSKVVVWQWTFVVAVICPCSFRVPSMFRAWRGGIECKGRRR